LLIAKASQILVMLALVAGIHVVDHPQCSDKTLGKQMAGGWVHIMTNRPNGTLYVGVTSDIPRRPWEHREGVVEGFTKKYGLKQLVYAERFDDITTAIQREKTIKHCPRARRANPIRERNSH